MIVTMQFGHAMHVCRNMTEADYREMSAIHFCGGSNDFADAIAVEINQAQGWKYTVLADDEPVAVGGLMPVSPGVLTVWGITTDKVQSVVREYTLFARKMIRRGMALPAVHRIQCVTACSHKQAHRWLELAGLERESTVSALGRNGEDYFMYRRLQNV